MKSQFKKVRRKFQNSAIGNLLGVSDEGREFAAWARKKEAKKLSVYYKLIGALYVLFTLIVIARTGNNTPLVYTALFLMTGISIAGIFWLSATMQSNEKGGSILLEFITLTWLSLGIIGALALPLGVTGVTDGRLLQVGTPPDALWKITTGYVLIMLVLPVTMTGAPRLLMAIVGINLVSIGTDEALRGLVGFRDAAAVMFLSSIFCMLNTLMRSSALHREYISAENFDRISRDAIPFLPTSLGLEIGQKISAHAADSFSNLTVVFADISGFTSLSKRVSPGHLVEILNDVFNAADKCARKLGLEKVKTIGDCYMAVAGGTLSREAGAIQAVEFARSYVDAFKSLPASQQLSLSVRVGIHTGPAVGGVIGSQRMAYDYWGETVNLASRLEGLAPLNGCAMSEATFLQVGDQFPETLWEDIEVRGVGVTKVFRHTF